MWDELAAAAWIDPSIITKKETRYMSVDIDQGAGYGNTLTWSEKNKPALTLQPVEIQVDLDKEKFYRMFVSLMSCGHTHSVNTFKAAAAMRNLCFVTKLQTAEPHVAHDLYLLLVFMSKSFLNLSST